MLLDLNSVNNNEDTPLHCSTFGVHIYTKYIELGADVTILNKKGRGILSSFAFCGKIRVKTNDRIRS